MSMGSKATPAPAPLSQRDQAGKELVQLLLDFQKGEKERIDIDNFFKDHTDINMDYQGDDGFTALNRADALADKSIKALLISKGAKMTRNNYNAANAAAPKKSRFSSSATSKNGNFTRKYKILKSVKNYKPRPVGTYYALNMGGKKKHLNTIYALDNYETNKDEGEKAVIEGKKRYQKLRATDSSKLSKDDTLEMNTLYYLLKKLGKVEGLPSPTGRNASVNTHNYGPEVIDDYSVSAARPIPRPKGPRPAHLAPAAANTGDPSGPAAAPAAANNAGDPTIEGTIQRMKCTVCQSQSIIDKALKPGEAPRKCDNCGAKAVVAAPAAAAPLSATPSAAAAAAAPALARPANNAPVASWIAYHKSLGKKNNDPQIMALKRQLNLPAAAAAVHEAEIAASAAAAAVEAASNAAENPTPEAKAAAAAAAANAARANANAKAAAEAARAALIKKAQNQIPNIKKATNFIAEYEGLSNNDKKQLDPINHEKYSVAKEMLSKNPAAVPAPAPAAVPAPAPAAPASAAVPAAAAAAPPANPKAELKKNYRFPEIEGIPTISVPNNNLNKELSVVLRNKLEGEQRKVKLYIEKLKHARNNTKRITKNELTTLANLEELNAKLIKKLNRGISTRKNRKNRRNTRTSRR